MDAETLKTLAQAWVDAEISYEYVTLNGGSQGAGRRAADAANAAKHALFVALDSAVILSNDEYEELAGRAAG